MKQNTIPDNVLAVLSAGRCDGPRYFLPQRQLDRKMYEAVNKVLDALGGKWNRCARAHVFAEDCEPLLDGAIESGTYTRPEDMGWFPTPRAIAEHVAELADIHEGHAVLEPSAGEGALASVAVSEYGGVVECHEIDPKRAETLRRSEMFAVNQGDFMEAAPSPIYDRVLMNPPFAKRADIHHVMHARKFLKPGGKLVAIMSAGVAFREDKLAADFRAQCESIEALPEGAFKESGTGVRTVVVTMKAA